MNTATIIILTIGLATAGGISCVMAGLNARSAKKRRDSLKDVASAWSENEKTKEGRERNRVALEYFRMASRHSRRSGLASYL